MHLTITKTVKLTTNVIDLCKISWLRDPNDWSLAELCVTDVILFDIKITYFRLLLLIYFIYYIQKTFEKLYNILKIIWH